MLSLSAAHLQELRRSCSKKRFVWVDIGGGTGRCSVVDTFVLQVDSLSRLQYRAHG